MLKEIIQWLMEWALYQLGENGESFILGWTNWQEQKIIKL